MNKIVLITTHRIGEGSPCAFPEKDKVYSEKLAEYLTKKYKIDDIGEIISCDREKIKTPEEIFNMSKKFLNKDQETKIGISIYKNKEYKWAIDLIKKALKKVDSIETNSVMEEITKFEKSITEKPNKKYPENKAKKVMVKDFEPLNRSLHDVASLYKYQNPDSDVSNYVVYGVMELAVPEKKYKRDEVDGWRWVDTLKDAIKEVYEGTPDQIILLLHDKDLDEYKESIFHCIQYEENGVSLAVFQHTCSEIEPIFYDNINSKKVFENLDFMLSGLSKMKKCNDNNSVSNGYKIIEKLKSTTSASGA